MVCPFIETTDNNDPVGALQRTTQVPCTDYLRTPGRLKPTFEHVSGMSKFLVSYEVVPPPVVMSQTHTSYFNGSGYRHHHSCPRVLNTQSVGQKSIPSPPIDHADTKYYTMNSVRPRMWRCGAASAKRLTLINLSQDMCPALFVSTPISSKLRHSPQTPRIQKLSYSRNCIEHEGTAGTA